MPKIVCNLICFLLCNLFTLNAQNFVWAKHIRSPDRDKAQSVALDPSGNLCTIGFFEGVCDFDPGPGTYTLSPDRPMANFISKMDSLGNLLWARQIGGLSFLSDGDNQASSIATDQYGNIYATAVFDSIVDMDPGPASYTLGVVGPFVTRRFYIAKFSSTGSLIWAKEIGGTYWEESRSIAVSHDGGVITTGNFSSDTDFDPGPGVFTIAAVGSNTNNLWNCFVSKLDSSGNFVWAKSLVGGGSGGNACTVDRTGNIYLTGGFRDTVDFDTGPGVFSMSTINGSIASFILKLNSNGGLIWAKQVGGSPTSYAEGIAIALDILNNVHTTGYFGGVTDFDPGTNIFTFSAIYDDIYISKLDSNGNFVWARQIGATDFESSNAIKVDQFANVYIAGSFAGVAVDLDPGPGVFTLTANGGVTSMEDVFIEKLDAMGNFIWAVQMGGKVSDIAYALAIDTIGNIYSAGSFAPDPFADFNPGVGQYILNAANNWPQDIFISRLSKQCFYPPSPTILSSPNACYGDSLVVNVYSSGSINWYASLTSSSSLSSGNTIPVSTLASGVYSLYAESRGCAINPVRTLVTGTVFSLPQISVTSNPSIICSGESATLTAAGAQTYTWSNFEQTNYIVIAEPYLSSYIATGVDSNGCLNHEVFYPDLQDCVGVDFKTTNAKILIFPNPVNEELKIDAGTEPCEILIFNMVGKLVMNKNLLEPSWINFTELTNGIYCLKVKKGDSVSSIRLVVQH